MVIVLLFWCHAGHPQPALCWLSHCCCCWYHFINSGDAAVIPTANIDDSWWLLNCVLYWCSTVGNLVRYIVVCNNVDAAIIIAIIHFSQWCLSANFFDTTCWWQVMLVIIGILVSAISSVWTCTLDEVNLSTVLNAVQQAMICYFYFYGVELMRRTKKQALPRYKLAACAAPSTSCNMRKKQAEQNKIVGISQYLKLDMMEWLHIINNIYLHQLQ